MKVFEKEYKFKYTPFSQALIAEHCIDKKVKNIIKTLAEKAERDNNEYYSFLGEMAEAFSKGYEVAQLFLAGKPLSELENTEYFRKETIFHMDNDEVIELQKELFEIMTKNSQQKVEANSQKKTEADELI